MVINNAGHGMGSVTETTPDDAAREIFETNFWGAARVNKEAVRAFRDSNPAGTGGRLVVISSYTGFVPLPLLGYYGATKHGMCSLFCIVTDGGNSRQICIWVALEAITQSLVEELDPTWNIKVHSVSKSLLIAYLCFNV